MIKKITYFLLLFFHLTLNYAYSQGFKKNLIVADSLFKKGDYPKANLIYQDIFYQEKKYSSQMLLHLAIIANKQQDYVAYLYWLNLYFQVQPSLRISEKISNTANTYELAGYELSDRKWFSILYHHYYKFIVLGICVISFLITWFFLFRKQSLFVYRRTGILLLIFLLFSVISLNIIPETKEIVIAQSNTYLMSAPSGASWVIGIAQKGQKLPVNNEHDIWVEVIWNNQKVFVKKTQVYLGSVF
ncbi:MAG: hypothetical protein MUC49_04355 [Raineya sp.]|jgi:hypothetical protein|nr:hypothetical protein [Raineya sp.]